MGKPDAPTPPNPYQTAAAQTGTNVGTGVANAFLNNVNQVTPEGSTSYDVTSNYSWNDPTTGHTYNIPRFTATQTLSPAQQAQKVQNDATKLNLATMGNQQSQRIGGILNAPFDPSSAAPAGGNAQNILGVGQARTSFDTGGDITRSYGPQDDFSSDRSRVEEALYGRLNPQLERDRAGIEQRLADQGIRYGQQAYASAMDDYNRQSTDARLAVTAQGGQEQQRMMDMAAQRAGFQNAAQQQAYQQNQGAASFENTGLAQQLAQQQSGFNAQEAQRNQYMQEAYQQRNQPLNEISALMSGSQVQQPNWLNTPQSQIATTDIGGLINQNFAQQQANYQTSNQNWQQLMGGIMGLGAGAMKMSDEREKKDVVPMGTVFSASVRDVDHDELPIYKYSYKDDPTGARHIGPMAQDVEKLDPKAVRNVGGRKAIDTRRVMGNILRAA